MCASMMLSKQNTITSDMWADVFSANETYGCTPPPPCAHFRFDSYHSVPHKAAATRADTYGDTSFSPRCSARLASPLQARASQLRWAPPASPRLCWITQNHDTEQKSNFRPSGLKKTLKTGGIKLGDVITAGLLLCRSAAPERSRRGLMDEKWVIIPGLT